MGKLGPKSPLSMQPGDARNKGPKREMVLRNLNMLDEKERHLKDLVWGCHYCKLTMQEGGIILNTTG